MLLIIGLVIREVVKVCMSFCLAESPNVVYVARMCWIGDWIVVAVVVLLLAVGYSFTQRSRKNTEYRMPEVVYSG